MHSVLEQVCAVANIYIPAPLEGCIKIMSYSEAVFKHLQHSEG